MWFRNHYRCARCQHEWTDEWSATCNDDCPNCGARHMSPYDSDDLATIVEEKPYLAFAVLVSSDAAEDEPEYKEVANFPTRREAEDYATGRGAENRRVPARPDGRIAGLLSPDFMNWYIGR